MPRSITRRAVPHEVGVEAPLVGVRRDHVEHLLAHVPVDGHRVTDSSFVDEFAHPADLRVGLHPVRDHQGHVLSGLDELFGAFAGRLHGLLAEDCFPVVGGGRRVRQVERVRRADVDGVVGVRRRPVLELLVRERGLDGRRRRGDLLGLLVVAADDDGGLAELRRFDRGHRLLAGPPSETHHRDAERPGLQPFPVAFADASQVVGC